MRLPPNTEIIGRLEAINGNVLVFSIQKEIKIPGNEIATMELSKVIGKKIGLININGKYQMRKLIKILAEKNKGMEDKNEE